MLLPDPLPFTVCKVANIVHAIETHNNEHNNNYDIG